MRHLLIAFLQLLVPVLANLAFKIVMLAVKLSVLEGFRVQSFKLLPDIF